MHSEGVYRGYIWPLVLVNAGLDSVPCPCFCVLIFLPFCWLFFALVSFFLSFSVSSIYQFAPD